MTQLAYPVKFAAGIFIYHGVSLDIGNMNDQMEGFGLAVWSLSQGHVEMGENPASLPPTPLEASWVMDHCTPGLEREGGRGE